MLRCLNVSPNSACITKRIEHTHPGWKPCCIRSIKKRWHSTSIITFFNSWLKWNVKLSAQHFIIAFYTDLQYFFIESNAFIFFFALIWFIDSSKPLPLFWCVLLLYSGTILQLYKPHELYFQFYRTLTKQWTERSPVYLLTILKWSWPTFNS